MKKITDKQREILDFIVEFIDDKGFPPTVREIGKAVNLRSSASVHAQLNKLEQKGYIKKDASSSRTITVLNENEQKEDYINIPVVGLVTAGNPIEAIETVSDYFPVPASMIKTNDTVFMLTVSGDSMINAGIYDGDKIIVKRSPVAKNGDIIVALTEENEATVKRFFKEGHTVKLQPENDNYEPIILNEDEVMIIGNVIGLFRDVM